MSSPVDLGVVGEGHTGFSLLHFFRNRKRVRIFNNSGRVMGLLAATIVLSWILYMFLTTFSSTSAMEDINHQLNSFRITKQQQDEWLQLHKQSYENPKRVLLVGLIASMKDLYENHSVLESMERLCFAYESDQYGGSVELQILYQEDEKINSQPTVSILREKLTSAGCIANFLREDSILRPEHLQDSERRLRAVSRYRKLARLRSLQRRYILSRHSSEGNFDAVLNVDLDIVQFPPIHALLEAIGRAADATEKGTGSIVCANGHETWTVGSSLIQRELYYDTFAAIDISGEWYYSKYAANLWQIITFGQTNLFRDILQQHPAMWPMQTCFGGLAIYDFPSWSNDDCDYDQRNVKLKADETASHGTRMLNGKGPPVFERQVRPHFEKRAWKLPPLYTIDHTPNGDVCEHVVFQQCLLHSALARNKPAPQVGIQPNLLIGREAAILTKSEDKVNLLKKILFLFLLLNGMSFLLNHLRERFDQKFRQTKPSKRRSSTGHYHKA